MAFVKMEKAERIYVLVTSLLLLGGVAAIIWATVNDHARLPEPNGRVEREDGESLAQAVARTTPEGAQVSFAEPGKLVEVGENEYEVAYTAQAWQFSPLTLEVPKGAKVRFYVTSIDVVHGWRIPDTQANAMIIPGQITKMEVTFDDEGDYWIICHEYCGIGHQQMGGLIAVT